MLNTVNTQKSPPWACDKGCAEACAERFSALNTEITVLYQTRTQSLFMCFGGERRLGVRLRRARGLMERDEGKIANPIFKTYLTFLVFSQHPARVINGVVSMSLPAQSKASVFNQSKRAYYLGYSIKCEHSLRKFELIKCSITRHSI